MGPPQWRLTPCSTGSYRALVGPCHHKEGIEELCGISPFLLSALGPQSFHFPLFMTMLHLAVIFLFSALSRALVQCSSHRARVVLSWTDYLRRVAPTGRSSMRSAARKQKPCGHTVPAPHLPSLCLSQAGSVLVRAGSHGPQWAPSAEQNHVAMLRWAKRFPRTSLEWAKLRVDGNLWPWGCEVRKGAENSPGQGSRRKGG